jgi:hypothetical protein
LANTPVGKVIGPVVTEDDVELVKAFLADLSTGWDCQPNDLKNTFLQLVLDSVVIYHETATIRAHIVWQTGLEQEILIHRPPANSRSRNWTEAELAILREHFETGSTAELTAMLPIRSWRAISLKANRMGLHRPDMVGGRGHRGTFSRWTKEEDNILRQYYTGEILREEMSERLDRTPAGILRRAHRLGLERDTSVKWEWLDKGLTVTKRGRSARR